MLKMTASHQLDTEDQPDLIPINSKVALVRDIRGKLQDDLKYCKSFIGSPLANGSPSLDKPFKQLLARAQILRIALEKIDGLNLNDEMFEANLKKIEESVRQ